MTCSNPSVKDSEKYSDRRDNWNKAIKITDDKSGMKILYYDVNDIYDNPALATTVGFSVVSSKSGDINTFEEKKVVVYGIYALKAEKELDARPSTTPSVTQPPAATNEPGATEVPTVTNEPGATEVPAATNEPGATEVPTVTNEPGATEVPTATNEPGATEVPTVTNEPGVTEVPTATNEPGVTEVPTVTNKPTATPTAPPTATPTATPTAPPEETKDYIYVINNPKGQTASEDNGEPGGQHISVDLTPSLPKDDITKYKELRVYYELYRDTDENTKAPFSGMGLVSSVYANVQAHDLIDEEGDEFLSDEVATIYGKDDNIGRDDRTPLYSSLDISSFTKKPNHLFWVLTNSVKMEEYEYIKVIVTKVEYIAK